MYPGMRNKALLAGMTIAGLFGTTLSASAALPGFSLAATTPRVSFYSRGEKVDVAGVEASLTRIEGTLDTRLAGRAAYYRYKSAQEVAAGTGHYAAGVTFRGQVHSTHERHDHELVHLVAAQMGNPGRFFQEGLAVALDDDAKGNRRTAKKALSGGQPVSRWIAHFDAQDPGAAYAVAGAFVRHLMDSHGIEKVRAFYRAARSEAAVSSAFTANFGQGLEPALAEWRENL
jgi:hypothetical protein